MGIEGMKEGEKKVTQSLASHLKDVKRWKIAALFGDRAFYNGDWLEAGCRRAGGFTETMPVEAVYPIEQRSNTPAETRTE
jgi:hypothetical protein